MKNFATSTAARVSPGLKEGTRSHRDRAIFLETVAGLVGCTNSFPPLLLWHIRPDVLKTSPDGSLLFLGEAKASERPADRETQGRLITYFKWISGRLTHEGQKALIVVCVGCDSVATDWLAEIQLLVRDARLEIVGYGTRTFGATHATAWAYLTRISTLEQGTN